MSAAAGESVLIGVFYSCRQAERAVGALWQSGFRGDQVRATLCHAELQGSPPQAAPPSRGCVGFWVSLIGLASGLAVVWLTGVVAALILGGLAGLGAGLSFRKRLGPPAGVVALPPLRINQGVVTVRPDGRAVEAAAILCRYAEAPYDAAALASAEGR